MPRSTSQPQLVPQLAAPAPVNDRVAAAAAGDVDAWAALYREHFDAVFRHVCYLTGDAHVAEDLVQETFARAMMKLSTYGGRAQFGTWLHGIAINLVRNHWRSGNAKRSAMYRLKDLAVASRPGANTEPDHAHVRRRRTEILYGVLQEIPENLREAFTLLDLQGLTPSEAAEVLELTPGNVSVRAHRARNKIHARLRELGCLDTQGDHS